MTTFAKTTDLPASVDTVEKLMAWVAALSHRLYYSQEYAVSSTSLAPVSQMSVSRDDNGQLRCYSIQAIPLSEDYFSATTQLWVNSQVISTVAIPAAFKV